MYIYIYTIEDRLDRFLRGIFSRKFWGWRGQKFLGKKNVSVLGRFLRGNFSKKFWGWGGSNIFLGKFRQVHNLKISDRLLRSKSFFQENIPGFICSVFRSARGGDGVGWEDADGRVSDG